MLHVLAAANWKAEFAPRESPTVVYNNAPLVPACLLQPIISTKRRYRLQQTLQTFSHITCGPDLHPTSFHSRQITPAPSSCCRASLLRAARTAAVASRYPVKIRGRPFSGPWQHVTGPSEPPKLISFRVHPTTRRAFIDQTGQGQGAEERGFLESTSDLKRLIDQLLGTNHEPRIFNLQKKTHLHNSGLVLGADQGTA